MVEINIFSLLSLLLVILLASCSGIGLSRWIPWSVSSCNSKIIVAFGLALAPFLAGFSAILALGFLAGSQHNIHLYSVIMLLAVISICWFKKPKVCSLWEIKKVPATNEYWILTLLLLVWCVALLFNSLSLPLLQHDPLEYAFVGRVLFEKRTLLAYPVLQSDSGFYGPWTHPPLYPALIYLTYLLQGHADFPGLMRLITPWFSLTTTFLVYVLGCRFGKNTGLIAALIFISTPLFYFGAECGSIDALVISGLTLLLTLIVSTQGSIKQLGCIQGIVLGLALWTHSQAILFIPLAISAIVLSHGWKDIYNLLRRLFIMLSMACFIVAWPYGRNLLIYGKLISDTPIVFSIPELEWQVYFNLNRGINSLSEKIQYGVLKGWFCFEAYAFNFWFMGFALIIYCKNQPPAIWKRFFKIGLPVSSTWLRPFFGVVVCYLSITVFLMLIGHNEIIRNERYYLVVIPCAALLSAWGITNKFFDKYIKNKNIIRLFCLLSLFQFIGLNKYRWYDFLQKKILCVNYKEKENLEKFLSKNYYDYINNKSYFVINSKIKKPLYLYYGARYEFNKITSPSISAALYIKNNLPKDALIFSQKPADLYYTDRRMISFLNPMLVSFYQQTNVENAFKLLHDYGVDYLHIPNYALPTSYNSQLHEIIAHPELTELVFSNDGYQIYRLREKKCSVLLGKVFDITPGIIPWTKTVQLLLGGRKHIGNFTLDKKVIMNNSLIEDDFAIPLFQRDWSTQLVTGIGSNSDVLIQSLIPVEEKQEYLLKINLSGKGYIKLYLYPFNHNGVLLTPIELTDITIGMLNQYKALTKRFIIDKGVKYIRIGLEKRGQSVLFLDKVMLTQLLPNKEIIE
ncbi:MAG: ArnT family glycosyltransferase [Candidatus Symbiodolus clandestinus]